VSLPAPRVSWRSRCSVEHSYKPVSASVFLALAQSGYLAELVRVAGCHADVVLERPNPVNLVRRLERHTGTVSFSMAREHLPEERRCHCGHCSAGLIAACHRSVVVAGRLVAMWRWSGRRSHLTTWFRLTRAEHPPNPPDGTLPSLGMV
jgi:hypothetical protein